MDIVCECGKWFELPYYRRREVLKGVENFCSPECLANYLLSLKRDKYNDPMLDPMVHECQLLDATEYWDKWTKKFYRSKSEAIAVNWFNAHAIESLYECFVIWFRYRVSYNPDFYLPYHNTWVEVKGLWRGKGKKKVKEARGTGFRVVVIPHYLIQQMERQLIEAKLF